MAELPDHLKTLALELLAPQGGEVVFRETTDEVSACIRVDYDDGESQGVYFKTAGGEAVVREICGLIIKYRDGYLAGKAKKFRKTAT